MKKCGGKKCRGKKDFFKPRRKFQTERGQQRNEMRKNEYKTMNEEETFLVSHYFFKTVNYFYNLRII